MAEVALLQLDADAWGQGVEGSEVNRALPRQNKGLPLVGHRACPCASAPDAAALLQPGVPAATLGGAPWIRARVAG